MKTLRESFNAEEMQDIINSRDPQRFHGMLLDLKGHLTQVGNGLTVTVNEDILVVVSKVATRNKILIACLEFTDITIHTKWKDGTDHSEFKTVVLSGTKLLDQLSRLELVHKQP